MRTKKYLSLFLSFAILSFSLTGCGGGNAPIKQVQEQGEIIQSVELEKAEEEDTVTPTYDINAIEESTTFISLKEKDSYYKEQLDSRNLIVYNEIKTAYQNYKTEVLLSKTITEEELFKIMTIMTLDDPMMFNIKNQYDYYLDSNGYIYKINLYYSINEITYRSHCDRLENTLLGLYSAVIKEVGMGSSESITEYQVLQYLINKNYAVQYYDGRNPQAVYNTTITPAIERMPWTTHGYAKYFNLLCRYLGLDCTIAIGKLTNDEYADILTKDSGYNIETYSDVKNKYTTVTEEDGNKKYTVKYSFDDYVAWNIIKINDSWYHFDHITGMYIATTNPSALNQETHGSLLHFVNDYTISMSRMYYYTEDLLGKIPLCGSNQFQGSYRTGHYLLTHTEEQMLTFLTYQIEIYPSRNTNYVMYQFQDEQTYNYFLNNFDKIVMAYNNSSSNKQILSYEIHEVRDELTIICNNFKYKK